MSPENGERARRVGNILSDFNAYTGEQIAILNGLNDFLTENLPLVDNLEKCNAALAEAGRPDLVITDRADMMAANTPEEVTERTGNFVPNFTMYTQRIEPEEDSLEGATLIPITIEELQALSNLPILRSFDEIQALEESGDFVVPYQSTHYFKPAFIRMLVLFPDFTTDLITRISNPENRNRKLRFEVELFVAYQLMSRLVDKNDIWVVKEGETEPDNWHLCH